MASDEDIAFVARALTTYCGPYKVFSENGEVRLSTHVEIALDPSWLGTAQVRRVSLREEAGKQTMILKPIQFLQLPVSPLPFKIRSLMILTINHRMGQKLLELLLGRRWNTWGEARSCDQKPLFLQRV